MGLIDSVVTAMAALGYPGVFVLMALESAGAPFPAEVVLPLTGYLVARGDMNLTWAIVTAVAGGLVGFLLQYAVGRYGGRPLLLRYGPYVLIMPHHLEQAERWFDRYGEKAVFFARLLPILRGLISLPAGTARMGAVPFVMYSVLGSVPWTIGLIFLGYKLGPLWRTVSQSLHQWSLYLLLAMVVAAALWWLRNRRRSSDA